LECRGEDLLVTLRVYKHYQKYIHADRLVCVCHYKLMKPVISDSMTIEKMDPSSDNFTKSFEIKIKDIGDVFEISARVS